MTKRFFTIRFMGQYLL